jgi:hypothetical protein
MATTKYKQTIKGSKDAAAPHQRLAAMLQEQIKAKEQARKNLRLQYQNARNRNLVTRPPTHNHQVRAYTTPHQP